MMREWHVPRSAFAPALTSGMVGMMVGGFIGGVVGDKLGRRVALLGSVISFGVLTLMVPLADEPVRRSPCCGSWPASVSAAAMPNAAALSSEYVPQSASPVRRDAHDRLHPARRLARRLHRRPDPAAVRLARAVHRRRPAAAAARRRAAEGAARIAALPGPPQGALAAARRAAAAPRPPVADDAAFVDASREAVGGRERVGRHVVHVRISVATRWRCSARSSSAC